jgi:hypothetical protein
VYCNINTPVNDGFLPIGPEESVTLEEQRARYDRWRMSLPIAAEPRAAPRSRTRHALDDTNAAIPARGGLAPGKGSWRSPRFNRIAEHGRFRSDGTLLARALLFDPVKMMYRMRAFRVPDPARLLLLRQKKQENALCGSQNSASRWAGTGKYTAAIVHYKRTPPDKRRTSYVRYIGDGRGKNSTNFQYVTSQKSTNSENISSIGA